jgi:hypothetical protein
MAQEQLRRQRLVLILSNLGFVAAVDGAVVENKKSHQRSAIENPGSPENQKDPIISGRAVWLSTLTLELSSKTVSA